MKRMKKKSFQKWQSIVDAATVAVAAGPIQRKLIQ